jgi:O-antigen ligase
MGTFVPVYAMQQRPEDAPIDAYVNRAHNDFMELWLEAGVAGLALVALFLGWLLSRSLQLWRLTASGREIDLSIARAATVASALIVAHSFVDYPLRTGAMMAIMAFACGLLVAPPPGGRREEGRGGAGTMAREAQSRPPKTGRSPNDVEWPEEWR